MASGSQASRLGERTASHWKGRTSPRALHGAAGSAKRVGQCASGRIDDHQPAPASLHRGPGELCLRNLAVALGDDEGHAVARSRRAGGHAAVPRSGRPPLGTPAISAIFSDASSAMPWLARRPATHDLVDLCQRRARGPRPPLAPARSAAPASLPAWRAMRAHPAPRRPGTASPSNRESPWSSARPARRRPAGAAAARPIEPAARRRRGDAPGRQAGPDRCLGCRDRGRARAALRQHDDQRPRSSWPAARRRSPRGS